MAARDGVTLPGRHATAVRGRAARRRVRPRRGGAQRDAHDRRRRRGPVVGQRPADDDRHARRAPRGEPQRRRGPRSRRATSTRRSPPRTTRSAPGPAHGRRAAAGRCSSSRCWPRSSCSGRPLIGRARGGAPTRPFPRAPARRSPRARTAWSRARSTTSRPPRSSSPPGRRRCPPTEPPAPRARPRPDPRAPADAERRSVPPWPGQPPAALGDRSTDVASADTLAAGCARVRRRPRRVRRPRRAVGRARCRRDRDPHGGPLRRGVPRTRGSGSRSTSRRPTRSPTGTRAAPSPATTTTPSTSASSPRRATSGRRRTGSAVRVTTAATATATGSSTVCFRSPIFFGERAKVRLQFDLPAGKPRSASDVRVGPAFASFLAWAFGDAGRSGSTCRPRSTSTSRAAKMTRSVDRSGRAGVPRRRPTTPVWFAWVNARNDDGLTREQLDLAERRGGRRPRLAGGPRWQRRVATRPRRRDPGARRAGSACRGRSTAR